MVKIKRFYDPTGIICGTLWYFSWVGPCKKTSSSTLSSVLLFETLALFPMKTLRVWVFILLVPETSKFVLPPRKSVFHWQWHQYVTTSGEESLQNQGGICVVCMVLLKNNVEYENILKSEEDLVFGSVYCLSEMTSLPYIMHGDIYGTTYSIHFPYACKNEHLLVCLIVVVVKPNGCVYST